MALPSSGPLSLSDIKGEFGGPGSPSLGDYYAGGSYVPSGTSGTYGAVPTGGTISIANFYGTQAALEVVTMTDTGGGYGYNDYLAFGAITPTTMTFAGNSFCSGLFYNGTPYVLFEVASPYISSTCFNNLNIGGNNFSQASASYYTDGSSFTNWIWYGVSNPFGAAAPILCTFT